MSESPMSLLGLGYIVTVEAKRKDNIKFKAIVRTCMFLQL